MELATFKLVEEQMKDDLKRLSRTSRPVGQHAGHDLEVKVIMDLSVDFVLVEGKIDAQNQTTFPSKILSVPFFHATRLVRPKQFVRPNTLTVVYPSSS